MRKDAAGAVDDQRRRLAAVARTAVKALLLAPANGNLLVTKTRDDSAKRCMSTNVSKKCNKPPRRDNRCE